MQYRTNPALAMGFEDGWRRLASAHTTVVRMLLD